MHISSQVHVIVLFWSSHEQIYLTWKVYIIRLASHIFVGGTTAIVQICIHV